MLYWFLIIDIKSKIRTYGEDVDTLTVISIESLLVYENKYFL